MADALRPDPELLARLQAALGAVAGVRLAVLFGSAASGKARPDSDVDIAVLAAEPRLDDEAEVALAHGLALVAGRNVDLIRLEEASTVLRWEVATKGVPLLERTPGEFARFRAEAASEYIDFAPGFLYYGEIFRRRLIEQGRLR